MSVYKRGPNWYARVSRPNSRGGYQRINKGGFSTKREAQTWEAEVLTGKETKKDSDLLLADYFKQWYETYKLNLENQTLSAYKSTYLAHISLTADKSIYKQRVFGFLDLICKSHTIV